MKPDKIYYLDNNATTRVAPEVVEAMLPFLTESWGNPSSMYGFARAVGEDLRLAREKVAALINADPREIVFTSCGTESNNSAIHSALATNPEKLHILTTAVEHSANIKFCEYMQLRGYEVTFLPVEPDGQLDLHLMDKSIRPDTAIVSIMWANNETGVLFPIDEIAAICRSRDVLFHTDAVQVAGKVPIDVADSGVDFLSLSAHKLNAPKGIGLLYVKTRTKYLPYVTGGGQERGRRGGTENVPYIIAFGRAAELALDRLHDENTRVRAMRDRLEKGILAASPRVSRNGGTEPRLPNTSNLSFAGVEAGDLLAMLDAEGICAASGSACTTGSVKPSHVLTAMGLNDERARSSIRFSLGCYNTMDEVEFVLERLPPIVRELRSRKQTSGGAASRKAVAASSV